MSHLQSNVGGLKPSGLLSRAGARAACVALLACLAPASAAELTLVDGVVVKFGLDAQLVVRDKLSAGQGVVLTSRNDDSVTGPVDSSPQAPAAGDWLGLRVEASSQAFGTSTFNDLLIRYAGGGEAGAALALRKVSPQLQYLQISDSTVGLRLDAAAPVVSGSSFLRNRLGVEAHNSSAPVIGSTQFSGNTDGGILNHAPATIIDATGNWWGHASGPSDPLGNPQGQGDPVSAGVNYGKFLTAVPLINPTMRLVTPAPYFESNTIGLQLSCVNAVEYRIAEGGEFSGVVFQNMDGGRATAEFAVSGGDGRKTLVAQFRGPDGSIATATLDGGALIDTEAPQVAITTPAPGSLIRQPITIEATASDVSGIQQVQFFQGGELLAADATAPYAHDWDADAVADGNYVIKAVATDAAGRTGETSVAVTVSHAASTPDTEGPQLSDVAAGGVAFADGATLTGSTTLTFLASDRSAIAYIELLLDAAVVAQASGGSPYSVALDLSAVANGVHTLALRATDSLGNVSTLSYSINVAHAAPDAPTLAAPAEGAVTRSATVEVAGNAESGSSVQVFVNAQPSGDPVLAGGDGRFSAMVTLAAGENSIQASATDQYGTSALSAPVHVTLDTTVPVAPAALTVAGLPSGGIRLAWQPSSDPNVVAQDIYRAKTAFDVIGEAQRLVRLPAATATYEEAPDTDGQFFYRVVAVNAADTPSLPSNQVSVVVDRTSPQAMLIEYSTDGVFDAETGTYGQGRITVTVTVSESLLGAPYLSLVPDGGLPIPVDLRRVDDSHYQGSFELGAGLGQGVATALFSARDETGNRGDQILSGATLNIDTSGPAVMAIALEPKAPIKVDAGRTVSAVLDFSEAIPDDRTPAIQYQLSGTGRSPVVIDTVERLADDQWQVSFELPVDAGATSPEQLSFSHISQDALGNASSDIRTNNAFQVYQGELPALNAPLGLVARALPAGEVRLEWQPVDGASGYQVYRQAPGETERTPLRQGTEASLVDPTLVDGLHRYTVASIRDSNGQQTLSAESAVAEVTSSRTAPGAPQNLQLSLTSQGVYADWQPPVGPEPASYRLYRAAADTITSVEGLKPLLEGIRSTQVMDAEPSQSEHAYVVTAVDAAGNESAISNSGYLNFSLLPVKQLRVEQIGDSLPSLSWVPNGDGAVGFDVYVGEGEARVKLTDVPTTATALVDTGFTGGERRYTVEAVDESDVRMGRGIVLPHLTTQIVSGLPLKRNIMNRIEVQVSNLSADALAAANVVLRLGAREFRSERFTLAGNATRVVPVIVGGYPDLAGTTYATVIVENAAHEGELARIGWEREIQVVDSALVIGLEAEEFVRGASGKVRLTVENTSAVQVELLTARANGSQPSSELRLKLLDADGNLLSTTGYRQVTGAGVVTLANGLTVARIAPGQRYVSSEFVMPVPASSPDQVTLRLEVDKLRYNSGQPDEVSIPGMGSERIVSLTETPYYGEVTSIQPVVSYGTEDIVIEGRALDRASGEPVPNAPLKLALNQEGFERLADVVSGVDGSFRYVFTPTYTDAGQYAVGAVHPDTTDRPDQARFTVNRIHVNPQTFKLTVPRNYPYSINYRASTGTGSQASNLRVVYAPEYQPSGSLLPGIEVSPAAPLDIAANQNLAMPVAVTGNNDAPPSGRLVLAVVSDGSGPEPLALLTVDFTLTEAKPALYMTPNYVETGLAQGQSVIEKVVFENKGFVPMNDVVAELVGHDGAPVPEWVTLATDPVLGHIGVGDKRSIDLNIAPGDQVGEGIYQLKLRVSGSNLPAEDVNVFVSVTQSGQGSVLFKAADIYTATRDENGNLIPGLTGARIYLQNEAVVSQSYELVTDAYGEAFFQDIPAGSYRFKASAQNHQEAGGRVVIQPGLTANQSVFLEYTLISVEWSVREITIEDRYEITLEATFETDVPAPVVVLQPTSINLPKMAPGEVFQGELVLTNYGLVRADDLDTQLPASDDYFKFEFLAEPPTSLEAKQRVRLPYRVIALRRFGEAAGPESTPGDATPLTLSTMGVQASTLSSPVPAGNGLVAPASSATGTAGCYTYTNWYRVGCKYVCANGTESTNCGSSANWFYVETSGCPAGSNPVTGGSGGGGGGGWGGSGGPGYSGMPGLPLCAKGSGDCYEPQNKQSGSGSEGGE